MSPHASSGGARQFAARVLYASRSPHAGGSSRPEIPNGAPFPYEALLAALVRCSPRMPPHPLGDDTASRRGSPVLRLDIAGSPC